MSEGFTTLSTNPLSVADLLGDKNRFVIPDYQREYQWKEDEQCEALWNDLMEQFIGNTEGHYYLGSVIVYPHEKSLIVIDGQQRLITLSLFLRQLYGRIFGQELSERQQSVFFCDNKESVDDKKAIWSINDPPQHRVVSEVLDDVENSRLRYALDLTGKVQKPQNYGHCRYAKNSKYFNVKIDEFCKKILEKQGQNAVNPKLVEFGTFILKHIYLLLIKSADMDDALTIFNTVNNRGMQLSDGDIIKAALFKQATKEESELFSKEWTEIAKIVNDVDNSNDDEETLLPSPVEKLLKSYKDKQFSGMTELFRVYMHVLRAQKGITYDLVGLRAFFIDGKNIGESKLAKSDKTFSNDGSWHKISAKDSAGNAVFPWKQVIADIKQLTAACQIAVSGKYPQISNWMTALKTLGKREFLMPLLIWLFKNVDTGSDGEDNEEAVIEESRLEAGRRFFREVVRFAFASSLDASRMSNKSLFEASASVFKADTEWTFTPDKGMLDSVSISLQKEKTPLQLGLVYVLELLRNTTDKIIPLGQVEHILPQKTLPGKSNSAGWEKEQITDAKFKLGNLVLLEQPENARASNYPFAEKKIEYRKSAYATAKKIAALDVWDYEKWSQRHKASIKAILDFLTRGQ